MTERAIRVDDAGAQPNGRVARVDFSMLPRIDKLERTPTGGVKVPARIAREGVLVYQRPDGSIRREYRPAQEAFNADSLASFKNAIVTVGHPPDALVSPATAKQHWVGHVDGEARKSDRFVEADLVVLDQPTIDAIGTGALLELSAGYTCVLEMTPGTTPSGEQYDAVQRDVRGNHVALLPPGGGRAGRDVTLRLDGLEAHHEDPMVTKLEVRTDSVEETINGRKYTVGTAEWWGAHSARLARLDELEKEAAEGEEGEDDFKSKIDALTKQVDAVTKERDDFKSKLDELTKKLGESEDETKMDSKLAERGRVIDAAKRVLGADAKTDGKSSDAIRREVLTKLDGADVVLDAEKKPLPAEHVRIAFEARVRGLPASPTSLPRHDAGGPALGPTPAPQGNPFSIYTPPGR